MQELRELLRGQPGSVPLDIATLQIGTIERPAYEIEPWLVLLDSYATEMAERLTARTTGEEFVRLFNDYLFEELGFEGNSGNYYDPANSCLQEVLIRRLGIPITLSVVYIEIARRLNRRVRGIGLPGHFLVYVEQPDFKAYVDPFHAGQILTEKECFELAREATGMSLDEDPGMLGAVSNRHIAIRMLNNLRAVYFQRREPQKAVKVLDLLIEATPDFAEQYKQRGICLTQTDRFAEARRDLETYMRLAPDAADGIQVAAELDRLNRLIALQA